MNCSSLLHLVMYWLYFCKGLFSFPPRPLLPATAIPLALYYVSHYFAQSTTNNLSTEHGSWCIRHIATLSVSRSRSGYGSFKNVL